MKRLTKVQHTIFDKLVYSKLRDVFGGEVKYAVGRRPTRRTPWSLLQGCRHHVLEGYGLTETTAGSTFNRPTATEMGSWAGPFPGSVRIADDGEVLLKGDHDMMGY